MTAVGSIRQARDRIARVATSHPDLILLLGALLVAALVRALFTLRAPLFIRHDSIAYLQTGYELATGLGFDLPLRRTPLYPLFVGGVVRILGEDLRALALAQHILGLLTVAATYLLGRAMFGRAAGLVASLLVAISAPLLIYEHYILAESLFIPLLVSGLLLVVVALRRDRAWLFVVGGLVLALAALSRPIGQVLFPVAPLAILIHRGGFRAAIRPAGLVILGFALILVPWMVRGAVADGSVGSAGAVGQTLIGRIIRHDEGFVLPDPESPSAHGDPTQIAVRRLILTQMARDARPSAINHRVRNQFGLSEAEANAAMRAVALEIFADQRERYVVGTLTKFRRLLVGEDERLRVHWSTRKDGELRDDWLAEQSIAHLYSPPSAVEEIGFPIAEAVTRIFQPHTWRWPLGLLIVAGTFLGITRGPRGPTVLLLLTVLALVLPSAALVGYVPRYRYPVDPLLAVLAAGGLVAALALARGAVGRIPPRGSRRLVITHRSSAQPAAGGRSGLP